MDWVQACKPKRHQFDSQSGHVPGLRARSPVEGCARGDHTLTFLSFSFSLLSPLSKNKRITYFKKVTVDAGMLRLEQCGLEEVQGAGPRYLHRDGALRHSLGILKSCHGRGCWEQNLLLQTPVCPLPAESPCLHMRLNMFTELVTWNFSVLVPPT